MLLIYVSTSVYKPLYTSFKKINKILTELFKSLESQTLPSRNPDSLYKMSSTNMELKKIQTIGYYCATLVYILEPPAPMCSRKTLTIGLARKSVTFFFHTMAPEVLSCL